MAGRRIDWKSAQSRPDFPGVELGRETHSHERPRPLPSNMIRRPMKVPAMKPVKGER